MGSAGGRMGSRGVGRWGPPAVLMLLLGCSWAAVRCQSDGAGPRHAKAPAVRVGGFALVDAIHVWVGRLVPLIVQSFALGVGVGGGLWLRHVFLRPDMVRRYPCALAAGCDEAIFSCLMR